MATPDTENTLIARGYKSKGFGNCRSCGVGVSWFHTPAGKWIPYNLPSASASAESVPYKDRFITPHWATCPNSKQHRDAANANRSATTRKAEAAQQPGLFSEVACAGFARFTKRTAA